VEVEVAAHREPVQEESITVDRSRPEPGPAAGNSGLVNKPLMQEAGAAGLGESGTARARAARVAP
jgi:hypothetical protein